FDFNLNGHNYISAEKIKCSHQEVKKSKLGNIKVVAETVPANSDDKIVEVYDHVSGKTWKYNSNKVAYGEVPIYNIKAGRQSWLTFKTKNGKTYTTNLYVPAEKLKKPTVVTYHNYAKVTVGSTKMMGTNARIQIYKGGKWTTVKTVKDYNCYKAITVKNLKPLTTYKFRTQAYANGTTGTPSDVVTLKTGSAVKPAVKSIKIVQKKKIKVRGWTSPGHWSGNYWYPPVYHKPYTWTKYKVKVTLKKKVPKIGGMRIGDKWTKGNKKSYTVWLPKGAQTGKKLNIYMNTGLSKSNGQGPQIKKVIRAK
ncbi:MAG: fibronectin type III domain-containing protein, partial [Eubacterium sp.]